MGKKKQSFLITFFLTLIGLIVIVVIVEKIFGATVSGIIGTISTGIFLIYIEKLDLKPTVSLKLPKKFKNTAYSTLVSILILVGLFGVVKGLLQYAIVFYGEDVFCSLAYIGIAFLLDWSAFIFAGLLIGKLYPKRALALTYIASFATFIIIYPEVYLQDSFDKLACLIDGFSDEYAEDFSDGFTSGAKIGAVISFIIRGYIAVLFAKISIRNFKS
ncbi:hypothetical protein ACNR9Q_12415 [Maribacter sp. X9]|uniref:hypothetical protein n=1 Tax=Maribacter sp. X9 TaxID=3402159 RepID=UPI003AF3444F